MFSTNISQGLITAINFDDNKIIIETDIKYITCTYTVDCCETSWFEKINCGMLEIDDGNTDNKTINAYINEKYIDLDNIIGKSIIGMCFIDNVEDELQVNEAYEGDDIENKLYKIILNDGFYSMFLLRCASNGYYTTELLTQIDDKN